MYRRGLVPDDLLAMPVWRGAVRLPSWQCDPLRLALVLAWDKRDTAPLAWAKVWREAIQAVRDV